MYVDCKCELWYRALLVNNVVTVAVIMNAWCDVQLLLHTNASATNACSFIQLLHHWHVILFSALQLYNSKRCLSFRHSIHPSICPSVTTGIASQRMKFESCGFNFWVSSTFDALQSNFCSKFKWGSSQRRHWMLVGSKIWAIFGL